MRRRRTTPRRYRSLDERERGDLCSHGAEGAEGRGVKGGARGVQGAQKGSRDRRGVARNSGPQRVQSTALIDLLGFYRDVLAEQFIAAADTSGFINAEVASEIRRVAGRRYRRDHVANRRD